MFFLRILINTIILFLILNFSKIKQQKVFFNLRSFILPFSLGFAITFVDTILRVTFFYSVVIFILIASVLYGLLSFFTCTQRQK